MQGMFFSIGQQVEVMVNGSPSQATIFGFELAWWVRKPDWLYHITIAEYPFDIQVLQSVLQDGASIRTNGNSVKVVPHEKAKDK